MDRRDFLTRMSALAVTPALPAGAFAASPAAAPAVVQPNLYTWSAAIARTHGKCSADMLKRMLHVDADKAASLFNRLMSNNVVGPADALGVSQARAIIPAPTGITKTTSSRVAKALDDKVDANRMRSVLSDENSVEETEESNEDVSVDPIDQTEDIAVETKAD